jgi:hypothetical protein
MYRQRALWRRRRPWLVLSLFVMPIGILLSLSARNYVEYSAIYLWLLLNNMNVPLLHSRGYWRMMLEVLPALILPVFVLSCVAWMAGALLAGLVKRTLWVNYTQLGLVLLCANVLVFPQYGSTFDANAAVRANNFYRYILPFLYQIFCILIPAFLGARRAKQRDGLKPFRPLFWVLTLICAFLLLAGFSTLWCLRMWALPPLMLAGLASVGPAGYLLTKSHLLHRRQV